jgi:GAF domain-containing protein
MTDSVSTNSSDALEQPDATDRLDTTTDALADLHELFSGEQPLDLALSQVATAAVQIIPDAIAITITVLGGTGPSTLAWTDEAYLGIDAAQYCSDSGPCLEAARTRQPVRASTTEHRERWPEFAAAAELTGVNAYLSVPLLVELADGATELVGAFNIYADDPTAFAAFDEALMRLFAAAATQAIGTARRWQRSRDQVRNLEIALGSRGQIDQAKGALMAIHRCSAEVAFAKLVEQSQRRNVKLRQVAHELLESVTAPDRT